MVFGSSKPAAATSPARQCAAWPPRDPDSSTKRSQGRAQSLRLDPVPVSAYVADPKSVKFLGTVDMKAFPAYVAPNIADWYTLMFNDPTHQIFLDAKVEDARNLLRLARYIYTQHKHTLKYFGSSYQGDLDIANSWRNECQVLNFAFRTPGLNFFVQHQVTTQLLYCCLNQLRHLKKDIEEYIPADESLDTPTVQSAIQLIASYARALQLSISQKLLVYARTPVLPGVKAFCDVARSPCGTDPFAVKQGQNALEFPIAMSYNSSRVAWFCGEGINQYITPSQQAAYKGMVPALNPKLCNSNVVYMLPHTSFELPVDNDKMVAYTQNLQRDLGYFFWQDQNVTAPSQNQQTISTSSSLGLQAVDMILAPKQPTRAGPAPETDSMFKNEVRNGMLFKTYPFCSYIDLTRFENNAWMHPHSLVPTNSRTLMAFAQTRYVLARRLMVRKYLYDEVQRVNYTTELCAGDLILVKLKSTSGSPAFEYIHGIVTRVDGNPAKPTSGSVHVMHIANLSEAKYSLSKLYLPKYQPKFIANFNQIINPYFKTYNRMLVTRDARIPCAVPNTRVIYTSADGTEKVARVVGLDSAGAKIQLVEGGTVTVSTNDIKRGAIKPVPSLTVMAAHTNSVPVSIPPLYKCIEDPQRPFAVKFNPSWAPYWAKGGTGATLSQSVVQHGEAVEQTFQVRSKDIEPTQKVEGGFVTGGAQYGVGYALRGGGGGLSGGLSAYFGMRLIGKA